MIRSHGLAVGLAAAALAAGPGRAAADYPEHEPGTIAPFKKWSRGVFFAGGAQSIAGIDAGGFGLDVEVARGHGRWQYFADTMLSWTSLAVNVATPDAAAMTTTPPPATPDGADGFSTRLGVGARRVVRAFEPDHSAAIELYLEGGAGLQRIWWNGGGTLTRPDLSLGAGWQVRGLEHPLFAIRLGVKVIVQAPVDDNGLCAGTCPPAGHHGSDSGFLAQFGASW